MKTRNELIEEIVEEWNGKVRKFFREQSSVSLEEWNKDMAPFCREIESFLRTSLTRISDASMDAVEVEEYEKLDSIKTLHRKAKSAFSSDSWDAGYHDALFDVEKRIIARTASQEKRRGFIKNND